MVGDTWAIVTTHNRHDMLHDLLQDLDPRRTVVVDHRCDPPIVEPWHVVRCECEPNISHLWNIGLDYVADHESHPDYVVAVLNDDLRVPAGTLEQLRAALLVNNCDVAFPDVHGLLRPGEDDVVRGDPGPHNLFRRMTGYAFMLRGEANLRADEDLVWWYGDDDLEWRATARRGTVRVGGATVTHLTPNGSMGDPALAAQAVKDRETFVAKWGQPPW